MFYKDSGYLNTSGVTVGADIGHGDEGRTGDGKKGLAWTNDSRTL